MFLKTTAVLASAILALPTLALAAAPPKTPPKVAPKPAPAKAAPAKPGPATESDFDARDPATLIALLNAAGAKAAVAEKEPDTVFVAVTSASVNFSMQFVECNPQGRACKAVLFDNITDKAGPSPGQLNAFNQSSVMCRGYVDKFGKPHVVYSTLLFADDSRERILTQLAAWRRCVGAFREFLKDPTAYLATAP